MRLVPPRSPLYNKRGLDAGGGPNSDNGSVRSPLNESSGLFSLARSGSVRQPKILEETSRLLADKPREVPRSVVQVSNTKLHFVLFSSLIVSSLYYVY